MVMTVATLKPRAPHALTQHLILLVVLIATESNKGCLASFVADTLDVSTMQERYLIPGAGGSGPYECVTDLISAFEAKFPEVDLSISSVGTGAGQAALWGDVDCDTKFVEGVCPSEDQPNGTDKLPNQTAFGIGGTPLKSDDVLDHLDLGLRQLPAFGGPILVVYSKDVTGDLGKETSQDLNMSYAAIAGIFSGVIDTWNHPILQAENPNLELPNERITSLVRSDKSGMSETLTEFLYATNPDTWPLEAVGKKPKWPLSNITDLSESSSSLVQGTTHWKADGQTGIGIGLLRRPFSIGFLELGYFSSLTQFVAQAHVSGPNNPTNYQPATVETLRAAMDQLSDKLDPRYLSLNMVEEDTPIGGYPISRYIYWYVKTSHKNYESCYQAWLLFTFLQWVYTDPLASEIALGHGWVIPPRSVVNKVFGVLEQLECVVAPGDEAEGELQVGDVTRAFSFIPPLYRVLEEDDSLSTGHIVLTSMLLAIVVLLVAYGAHYHFVVKKRSKQKSDTVWRVKQSEIKFGNPPEVIGAGTFGQVLLGTYRGTDVAVKRVIPPKDKKGKDDSEERNKSSDSTEGEMVAIGKSSLHSSISSMGSLGSLGDLDQFLDHHAATKDTRTVSYSKLKAEFIDEMRYLSKLRHPCITMIMGAVADRGQEPLLVMEYCLHGSLYDILHNQSASLEGDFLLPILRDISQGVLFLHAASPQCIHSDLKTANILVDNKFRAKVADFGLSGKKSFGASGTPAWMAPELLRKESTNTAASDVYALGVIFYEMYSRKDPYEGEDTANVLKEVADPSINKRPAIPPGCPAEIVSLMKECWQSNPQKRPCMQEIDQRLKRLDVSSAEPGDQLSKQLTKNAKAAKSEDLLYKVFPKHIADTLREGRKVEPEHHDCVSIFFSDVVGFTTISSQISPTKVSDMLDRLYARFDALSIKHDAFKIETIGDAYLCVTNLVSKQENDHVKRIAEFSIDAIQAASETLIDMDNPSMGCVRIRVGFHSGPVIASVVGTRLPKFGMFGDTINTASRMESNSEAGRIHCSKQSAELLEEQDPNLLLISRGEIEIKGKGLMETFWVEAGAGFHVAKPSNKSDGSATTQNMDQEESEESSLDPTNLNQSSTNNHGVGGNNAGDIDV